MIVLSSIFAHKKQSHIVSESPPEVISLIILVSSPCKPQISQCLLMWNSILSTEGAKYMCLDIKKIYLTAPLDRFKYIKMLIALFPKWIVKPYNIIKHVLNSFIYFEMRRAM